MAAKVRASFEPEPDWLGEDDWNEADDVETKDGYRLRCSET
jgi:hypothetical protein